MPLVIIKILKEYATPEFKAKLIEKVSEAIADICVNSDREKLLDHLYCIIEEVPMANWGVHGVGMTEERLRKLIPKV